MRLAAGGCAIALHAIPASIAERIEITTPPKARADTPIKLAFHTDDVERMRGELSLRGAVMFEIVRFGDVVLCDGLDPEGNVFQITTR